MAIITAMQSFYVGKGKQHHAGQIVDGGATGYIDREVPTCTDCGGYERYGARFGIGHSALCPERLRNAAASTKAGSDADHLDAHDKAEVLEALFKHASALLRLDLTAARAAVEKMGEYTPGCWPASLTEKQMAAEGADEGDVGMPLFSEAYLYPLFGKDEARTILAKWRAVKRAVGMT